MPDAPAIWTRWIQNPNELQTAVEFTQIEKSIRKRLRHRHV